MLRVKGIEIMVGLILIVFVFIYIVSVSSDAGVGLKDSKKQRDISIF